MAHEIARVPWLVKEQSLAAIRLAWWRDALTAVHAGGRVEHHPALVAYAPFASNFSLDLWRALIEAHAEWIAPQIATWDQADALVERTEAPVLELAAAAAGDRERLDPTLVKNAARAWGYVACLLSGRGSALPGSTVEALVRARAAYDAGRAAPLPASLFPAFGHIALTPLYQRALARGQRAVPLLTRQMRLVFASARGRL